MVKQAIKRAALALLMCAFAVCLALGISLLVPQAQSAYAEETDPNVHTTHDSSWQRLSSGYSSGRYYLGGDHDRDMVINGDVTLCLNGHILRGTGKGPVITVSSGAKLTLCDCQSNVSRNRYTVDDTGLYIINNGNTGIGTLIAGGIITGGKLTECGGGIYVDSNATFVMEGGTIAGNTASNYGGGVYLNYNSTFNMNGGTIVGNTVNDENSSNVGTRGGGVCAIGARNGVFTMSGNAAISNNTAISKDESKSYGGGVFFDGPIFEMSGNAKISGNVASCGGSIDVVDFFMSDNAQISDNMATDRGGVNCANFTMNGGTISGNTATEAGVNVYGDTFIMNGGEISGNTATDGYSVWVWCDNFTINGGYFGEGEKIYYIPNNGTVNIYGGYFANQDTITDNSWLVNATVQPISSIADDVNYKEGYGYAVYHMHETEGEGDDIIFKPLPYDLSSWDGSLSGGNYYLPYDVTLTNNITIDSDVTLCLNGHTLTGAASSAIITISSGATFTLCDCSVEQTGTITGASNPSGNDYAWQGSGGAIMNHGTFTMYGGNLSGNTADMGGGIFTRGPVYIYGGTISGNTATTNGGGIYINTGATVTLDGGEISNNNATTRGDGVYVGNGTFTMKSGTLTENAEQGVNVNGDNSSKFYMTGGYFGSNSIIVVGTEANATVQISGGYFETSPSTDFVVSGYTAISDTSVSGYNYQVVAESAAPGRVEYNGTTSYYGTINAAFNYANEVSTSSARAIITLQNNVTTSTTLEIESGKYITLDLNGYILRMTGSGSVITVNNGANFTLCDCKDGDTSIENTIETDYVSHTYNSGVITGGTGTRFDYNSYGGGVYVNGGTFTMSGGTIAGNNASQGGGVYVSSYATFEMSGGAISGSSVNTDGGTGGGVYVDSFGIFIMENGTISGNTAYAGGGVFVHISGTFTMENGTISGNTATRFGGGMNVNYHGTFTMSGGYFGENTLENDDGTVSITGGYFADGDILEDEWLADEDGNSYTAVDISAGDHYGDTGYVSGYPYAVYASGSATYSISGVNTTYNQSYTLQISGNSHGADVSYSYSSGGSSVNGLPSDVGQHSVTATFAATVVTNEDGTKTYYPLSTVQFTVTIAPVITTNYLSSATYGIAYNQKLEISSENTATWSIASGLLPTGLTLNASTGVISGTPMDVGGRYIFTVCATVNGISTEQEFSIMLNKASQSAPAANEGYIIDYSAETITILDGYEVYTAQDSGTQIISGSITNYIGQTVYIRLAETDTHNLSGWTAVTVPERPAATAPALSGSAGADGFTVSAVSGQMYAITKENTAPAIGDDVWTAATGSTFEFSGLDAGEIYYVWTYTPYGTSSFNSLVSAALTVNTLPVITTESLDGGTYGTAYSATLEAESADDVEWSIASGLLPTGLTLNASTGVISGTPTAANADGVTFTVRATVNGVYAEQELTIVVAQRAIAVTISGASSVYGDTPAAPSATVTSGSIVEGDTAYSLSCKVTAASDVGFYDITGKVENSNYAITFVNEQNAYEVQKREVTVTITPNDGIYGSVTAAIAALQNLVNDDDPTVTLTYTGTDNAGNDYNSTTVPTNAGTYTVTVSITDGNYKLTGDVTATFVISKATYDMSGVSFVDAVYTYDGSEKTLVITGTLPAGVTVEYTANTLTNAGSVTVTASFIGDADNYNAIADMTATLKIDPKNITGATVTLGTALTYNGQQQEQTITSVVIDGLAVTYEVSGNVAANAGDYVLTVTGSDNFTGTATADWNIAKRALTANMFQVTGSYTYTGAEREATYTFADRGGSLAAADFEVSYSNNVNAGNSAVITFTAAANGNYSGSVSLNFTIEKATYDMSGISFGNATYTYDGTEKTLVILGTLPGGVTVTYTTNTLTNAGSLEVTASFTGDTANYNAIADMTATLTINKATYNMSGISFENATYTYDGNEKTLAISGTLPSGVTVTYTNNGHANAGTYTVTASFTGNANYNAIADMTATLKIDPKNITGATVTLGTALTYNGQQQEQTITSVVIDGLAVTYEVSGNVAANAGDYVLTVTGSDNFTGTATADWNIAKRALTANMFQVTGSYVYTGAGCEATYTFSDGDGNFTMSDFGVNYSNNVNAGNSAVITFTATDSGNYSGSVSLNFSIAKADYDMSGISFGNATYTYDGTEKTLVITGELPSGVIVSYTTNTLTNAGSLEVTASFTGDTANYNAIADMTATLTINKATYNMSGISFENATYTYDGNEKTLVISGTLPSGVTVTYTTNTLTNAGSIEVTASFTGDADNYNAIADMTATLTIEKATYDMSGIKFEDVTYTYDGSEKTLVITGNLPDGVTVSYTTNTLTNAGSVEVTASFMGDTDNYNAIADMTATITVDKATYDISGVKFEDATYTYDGEDKTLTISGTLPDGVTVSYTTNTLTNAGSIEVTAMFTGDANNYNTIAPMTATLTIEKATPEYTMPDGLTAVTGQTLDEIELPDGWSWQDGTLSVGEAGENTFTAVYTPVDTDNYNVVTVEINVTVEQATDNTIHYIIWGCIAGIAVVGAVIGWIIVVCVKKRRAKNGE